MKCIYIGALHDITPLITLPNVDEFVFVDSMPNGDGFDEPFCLGDRFIHCIKHNDSPIDAFINVLRRNFTFAEYEFVSHEIKKRIIIFKKGSKTLYYIYNTVFPNQLIKKHRNLLKGADYLFVAGFFPHKKIRDYLIYDFNFAGSVFTNYEYDIKYDESIVNEIYEGRCKAKEYILFITDDICGEINYEGKVDVNLNFNIEKFKNLAELQKSVNNITND